MYLSFILHPAFRVYPVSKIAYIILFATYKPFDLLYVKFVPSLITNDTQIINTVFCLNDVFV